MVHITQLWLPILLSAVAVVLGSFICMILPIHRHEFKRIGGAGGDAARESAVFDAIRSWGLPAGMYLLPPYDPADRDSPRAKELEARGPWGVMMLRDRPWNMGAMLGLWALNALIISFLIAYLAAHTIPAGTPYRGVFRIVAVAALLAYGGSALSDCIWKGRPWRTLPGAIFDAVVYAGLTAGVFGWKWP